MTTGEKLRRIRSFRAMTQQELGLAVGFGRTSASTRIAQYENNQRTPRKEIVEKLAKALKVNTKCLMCTPVQSIDEIIELLFWLEEMDLEDDAYYQQCVTAWKEKKEALRKGDIDYDDYLEWKLQWPDNITSGHFVQK